MPKQEQKSLKVNPIVEAAKARSNGKVQRLSGYIGKGASGKIELYLDLRMNTCLEIEKQDVLYSVEPEKPTEPALLFVLDEARIIIRHESTASSAAALVAHSCECSTATPSKAAIADEWSPINTLIPKSMPEVAVSSPPPVGTFPPSSTSIAKASGCGPCSIDSVSTNWGGIVTLSGTRRCCVNIPVLQPDLTIRLQEVCWTEKCGHVMAPRFPPA